MVKKPSKSEEQGDGVSQRDRQVQERLQKLREEYGKLHEKKIATERDRQNLEERLKELREQAEREYGTSDIEQLRRLLEERRKENERMIYDYQLHVEHIRERLVEIESGAGEES